MKTIHKYEIRVSDMQKIELPVNAEILTVQVQKSNPYIWAIIDDNSPMVERVFEIFGTGILIDDEIEIYRKYIGTFQLESGSLVLHLFERLDS